MGRSRFGRTCAVLLGGWLLLPSTAAAQQQGSSIVGVVKDSTGAVLPGVTVEAASPVLIEKVRSAITDNDGQYRLVDLRPGTYTVTFTLPGFTTVKRDEVAITSGFTATINAEMQVGSLAETVTVTGASPLVDTQNARQQTIVSGDLLTALPTSSKALGTLVTLIPGMVGAADVGGASGIYTSNATYRNLYHGKGGVKFLYDGMNALNMNTGATSYIINPSTVEETAVETGGVSAESTAAGVLINMVPKEGGNTFRVSATGFFTNDSFQSDNLTDELRARGLTTTNKVLGLYDSNVTVGGPIKTDQLWFFAATRFGGTKIQVPGVYFTKNPGSPIYTPDLDRPAYRQEWLKGQAVRLTWQVSEKNKINGFADFQSLTIRGRGEFTAPEAATAYNFYPQGLYQTTWSSPRTSRLLLEAGFSWMNGPYPYPSPGDKFMQVAPDAISILEQSTGFRYNARSSYTTQWDNTRIVQRFSASYVVGSHSFKAGMQLEEGISNQNTTINQDITYTFLRGVPNSLTLYATPYLREERMRADMGLYAQDQWKLNRLTLNYGVRFDYFNGYVPPQHVDAGRFGPERSFDAVHDVPDWRDINPRFGASYDLFGNGRTAVKASIGRYVEVTATTVPAANNPITTSVNSVNRTWNDNMFPAGDPRNGNFIPDCDLKNPAGNGECGPFDNTNFGQLNVTTRYLDDVLNGFGARNSSWDFATEIQHQLFSRVSVTAGYYRNWAAHFRVTDNLLVTPSDFSEYCITSPVDPRLPGGGGQKVCGLYDVAPAKFGQVNNVVTQASNFDPTGQVNCGTSGSLAATGGSLGGAGGFCGVSDFIGVSFTARVRAGTQFGGGVDTGRTVNNSCLLIDSPQNLLYCKSEMPFSSLTQVKLHASQVLPAGFTVSATFQNVGGPMIEAFYNATNAEIAPSLGRNLAACGTRPVCTATARVPLIAPGTEFEDRRNQLDLRITKAFRVGRNRIQANLDIYNALNGSAVLGVNSNYGSSWLLPIAATTATEAILQGRLVQLGAEFRF
jgi:hypothetical protein